jgi:regulator of sirC expression with transglutaminase-like and TPR domain
VPATKQQILARMLLNLKRLYIAMRSFPYARVASDLLLAVDPAALHELRDRGLISYHLQDFSPALRDLQDYLRLSADLPADREEREQLWEHVKNLRRRVSEMN